MRHSISLPLLALLAAGTPRLAAQATPPAPVADSAGIAATRGNYSRLFAAGDAAGLAALYTEDATLDLFGAPRMRGRAAIEAGIKAAFGMQKPISLEITSTRLTPVDASAAAELGTYHQMDSVKTGILHSWGRYVSSMRRDSTGTWRLAYLMGFPDSTKTTK
ncbi:MAG TPA: nuclear transport factor 2 family protein [Gemmatimonadales bacterium]|nr:nuclear transport factor 2 family protein [Gemmatimonadales bacterium]